MAKQTSSPIADAVARGWQEYAEQLVVVVRPLSDEQLAQRIAPNLRSAGEIVAHLITGRAFWFQEILKEQEGNAELKRLAKWFLQPDARLTGNKLAHGLEVTAALIREAIARWTPEELAEQIVLPWIGPKYPITRAWVVWHVIEHDLHHGGELTQTLGLSDPHVLLPPPPPED
ncbi:MAG: DinB family protein [Ktedonobacterales bacterium]